MTPVFTAAGACPLGAANLVTGIGIQLSGPWRAGAIPVMLGLLLLRAWRNRRRRRRTGTAGPGARSLALPDALARRLADRTIPLPA